MFDKGYPFNLVDKKSFENDDLLTRFYYNFRGKRRYVIVVEEYKNNILIVKFYPYSHRHSHDKYNVVLKDFDAARVIRTAIDVMLFLFEKNPKASFGFIAANSITRAYNEGKYHNQRFRIYSQLMSDFFSNEIFAHTENEVNSAYLLVNRCNSDIDEFTNTAIKMFIKNYPELEY